MDRLPNFLIIGAQKSGTTSLYNYLKQHPQIFMSRLKEPHFFTYEGQRPPSPSVITSFQAYKALFSKVRDEIAVGEASPSYLHGEQAPRRIARYFPMIKMIAILRNPADRAYSNWMHNVSYGREDLDFGQALQAEERRVREGAGYLFWYKYKGFYHQHLARYLALFDRDQLRVYLFEDLKADPQALVRDAFEFLGVDRHFQPRLERHNVSGLPRGLIGRLMAQTRKNELAVSLAKRLLSEPMRRNLMGTFLVTSKMPAEARSALIEEYRDDILRLAELLQRDLSSWLQ